MDDVEGLWHVFVGPARPGLLWALLSVACAGGVCTRLNAGQLASGVDGGLCASAGNSYVPGVRK